MKVDDHSSGGKESGVQQAGYQPLHPREDGFLPLRWHSNEEEAHTNAGPRQ